MDQHDEQRTDVGADRHDGQRNGRRTVVITGASDGIGAAAARELTARGHDVVVVGRSGEKTAAVAGPLGVRHFTADFARLDDVRRLARELQASVPRIDVLVNNAGGIFDRRELTPDGHELTWQVNHLAPFLLTHLLLDRLLADGAAVLTTSSVAAHLGRLSPETLVDHRRWSPQRAYGDTKLANILFTRGLDRRYGPLGLTAAAFHPGGVATNFASGTTTALRFLYRTRLGRRLMITPEQGAETLVWLADGAAGRDWGSGGYYEKKRPARAPSRAADDALADTLWQRSPELVGLTPGHRAG
ncbi:SDR family NAD(P)-dependent oxidoreductase [Kocuria nitroreducens]|uniref:SDR family NAD(P)-dependent oxidoreductase n=1 Tax=Kocuria nitroreducens TaxID=3058914 RepID=UPI0036DA8F9C